MLGQSSDGSGTAVVRGVWYTGDLIVGDAGGGEISLVERVIDEPYGIYSSAGELHSDAVSIGAQPGSSGVVNVIGRWLAVGETGASTWDVGESLSIGGTSGAPGGEGRLMLGATNEVSVAADLKMWPGAELSVQEGGRLEAAGAAALDGVLEFQLGATASPQLGAEFQVLSAVGGVTGAFSSAMLPVLDPGLQWIINYEPTSVVLEVVAAFAADFDEDGDVDGDDLEQWKGDFGVNDLSDADDDGDSDGADFLAWQRQLGSAPVVGTARGVPEPALGGMSLSAAVLMVGAIGRRTRSTLRRG